MSESSQSSHMPLNERIYRFVQASGLRPKALACLKVEDLCLEEEGRIFINVNDPDGIPIYEVPVLAVHVPFVLSVIDGRESQELVFSAIPRGLHLHVARIQYARALYREALTDNEMGYNEDELVQYVMHCLCENHQTARVRRYLAGLLTPTQMFKVSR